VLESAPRGGYVEPQSFREQYWRPAQMAAGVDPIRRPYDLRPPSSTGSRLSSRGTMIRVGGRYPGR
jgi:hypothetical protein